jgi:hypothetical protein
MAKAALAYLRCGKMGYNSREGTSVVWNAVFRRRFSVDLGILQSMGGWKERCLA